MGNLRVQSGSSPLLSSSLLSSSLLSSSLLSFTPAFLHPCFPLPLLSSSLLSFTPAFLHPCFPSPLLSSPLLSSPLLSFTPAFLYPCFPHPCFPLPLLSFTPAFLYPCFPLPLLSFTPAFLYPCFPHPCFPHPCFPHPCFPHHCFRCQSSQIFINRACAVNIPVKGFTKNVQGLLANSARSRIFSFIRANMLSSNCRIVCSVRFARTSSHVQCAGTSSVPTIKLTSIEPSRKSYPRCFQDTRMGGERIPLCTSMFANAPRSPKLV